MFKSHVERDALQAFFESWTDDPRNMKGAFKRLQDKLLSIKDVKLSFISRPSVSYSLRASLGISRTADRVFFVLMDIVDDQAEGRWLSVCFYSDLVSDPKEQGNLVPEGILGEDGYCFDLFEYDEELIFYIEQRFDEACARVR